MRTYLVFVAVIAVFIACFTFVLSTQTIELPKDFCEVDRRNECKKNQCVRYDPKKFMSSPSLVTYFPNGRLGNKLTAYLTLLWIGLETGLEVLYEKESFKVLDHYFENINLPVLEDSLCDWRQFPFKKYEGNMELLGRPEWATGQAIQLFIDKSNFMRHEIQGGRQYYKKYRTESLRALTFRKNFRDHANKILSEIAKKVEQDSDAKVELTFVGIHNRRTDYLEFRKRRLGLDNLYEDYFQDAMEYFRDEYDHPVFIYVSDDMPWGRKKLKGEKDLFFVGCGSEDLDCTGKDFAVLSSCNHTITTHGSFGHWASYISGGEIYTEYGPIIP